MNCLLSLEKAGLIYASERTGLHLQCLCGMKFMEEKTTLAIGRLFESRKIGNPSQKVSREFIYVKIHLGYSKNRILLGPAYLD